MLAEMTASQQVQVGVNIAIGAATLIVMVLGWFIAAWRSGKAHAEQKAEMKAEVSSIKGDVAGLANSTAAGFGTVNLRIDHLRDITRQSLEEGTRRMGRHSQNISELKDSQAETAESLAALKGQLGT